MNFEQARANMVEQQVRPWEVLDDRVLSLFEDVPREDFVPVRYRKLAFSDLNIPLDHKEIMMRPIVEGRMLQAVTLAPDETVLEVGTGSGFVTACLAHLAKSVTSVDYYADFTKEAGEKLASKGIDNVELHTADVMTGWQPDQAHDVVVVTGSVPAVPEVISGWVHPGGRLFVVRGHAPAMEAVLMTRINATEWREESLFETDLPRLIGAEEPPKFEF